LPGSNVPLTIRTWDSKLVLVFAGLLEHLDTMVIGVGRHNIVVDSQTEAMRGVELSLSGSQLPKLAPMGQKGRLLVTSLHG
jgi:hypothetical protein